MPNPSKQRAHLPLTDRSTKTKPRVVAIGVYLFHPFIPGNHPKPQEFLNTTQSTRLNIESRARILICKWRFYIHENKHDG